jgi:hypothetical protein
MEDAIINTVLDYGALGIFAGFMVWQHITMQKRQREDQAASSERVDKLQTRFEEREEALRDRYDTVVKDYQDRHEEVKDTILSRLSELHLMMETGLGEMRSHYQEAKMKELSRKGGGK